MSLSANYPAIRPSLLLDFINAAVLSPRVTFTRASSATYFDQLGVLQTAGNDVPRFDFDPATLAARGLLIEEQRTNSIRNNTMQGASAGVAPTNWSSWNITANGVTIASSAAGTENGIAYIDVAISGTCTLTGTALTPSFEAAIQIAATVGQTWTESVYCTLVSGSLGDSSLALRLTETDSGGFSLTSGDSAAVVPAVGDLRSARYTFTRTNTNASTVFIIPRLRFGFVNGNTYNFTLRIGLPQLELGAFATSVIPTTTAAATRSMDVASMTGTNFSSWYNAVQGTLFAEALISDYTIPAANFPLIASMNDGTNTNSIDNGYLTASLAGFVVRTSSVDQAALFPNVGAVQQRKVAGAYRLNDFAVSANGGAVQTDTSGTVPTVDRLRLGERTAASGTSTNCLNGHLRRIAYYPRRLTNAQLQALTAS